jgi:hypothetical protein
MPCDVGTYATYGPGQPDRLRQRCLAHATSRTGHRAGTSCCPRGGTVHRDLTRRICSSTALNIRLDRVLSAVTGSAETLDSAALASWLGAPLADVNKVLAAARHVVPPDPVEATGAPPPRTTVPARPQPTPQVARRKLRRGIVERARGHDRQRRIARLPRKPGATAVTKGVAPKLRGGKRKPAYERLS